MIKIKDVEAEDARKVNEALQAYTHKDFVTARIILERVIANCPANYLYQYIDENKEFIKFWDQAEFMQYTNQRGGNKIIFDPDFHEKELPNEGTVWIISAYPRALFYLACIDVEERKFEDALLNLETCLKLEPDQPKCFIEMACIYGGMGQTEKAITLYDIALNIRLHIPEMDRARALRGKGFQLIEMGKLEVAKAFLTDSLSYEPLNKIAIRELDYINELESGMTPLTSSIKLPEVSKDRCSICWKEMTLQIDKAWVSIKENGRVVYICFECNKKLKTSRWQFWKKKI